MTQRLEFDLKLFLNGDKNKQLWQSVETNWSINRGSLTLLSSASAFQKVNNNNRNNNRFQGLPPLCGKGEKQQKQKTR